MVNIALLLIRYSNYLHKPAFQYLCHMHKQAACKCLQAACLIWIVNEVLFAVVLVIGFAAAKALFDGVVVVEED